MAGPDAVSDRPEASVTVRYVPPPTEPFRVYSVSTKAYLYTNGNINRRVFTAQGTSSKDDQWFTADVNPSQHEQVSFRSKATSEWISLGHSEMEKEISTFPKPNDDEQLLLLEGDGSRVGQFRIYCPFSKLYAVATSKTPPGVYKLEQGDGDNAWWQFSSRDPTLVGLKYLVDQGQILDSAPLPLNSQTFDSSDTDVQHPFVTKQSVDHTSLWKLSSEVMKEFHGDFGVPGIARGKIVIRPQSDLRFKFGETLKQTKEWSEVFTLDVPSKTSAAASASVTSSNITVPFIATFRSGETSDAGGWDVQGTYTGTTTHDYKLKTEYNKLEE